jgi:hypothetical protein
VPGYGTFVVFNVDHQSVVPSAPRHFAVKRSWRIDNDWAFVTYNNHVGSVAVVSEPTIQVVLRHPLDLRLVNDCVNGAHLKADGIVNPNAKPLRSA